MNDYINRISPINLDKVRKLQAVNDAEEAETNSFYILAGILLFLAQELVPEAFLVTSKMQQRLGC